MCEEGSDSGGKEPAARAFRHRGTIPPHRGRGCGIRRRERGRLEKEKYNEIYRRFRELYPLPSQLIQHAMNQGIEIGRSFLELKKDGRVHKPRPEVRRVSIRFAKDSWNYKKAISSTAPVKLTLSLPGGRREIWIKPHRRFWLY